MPGWNDPDEGMFSTITADDFWRDFGGGLGIAALILGAHTGAIELGADAAHGALEATDNIFPDLWNGIT